MAPKKWKLFLILVIVAIVLILISLKRISDDEEVDPVFVFKNANYNHQFERRVNGVQSFWFLNGPVYPNATNGTPQLLPEQADGDRILEQLMYKPETTDATKTIVLLNNWNMKLGKDEFQKCPVNNCKFLPYQRFKEANALIFADAVSSMVKPPNQIWILYQLESPKHTSVVFHNHDPINWTATYRSDSDIVAPYQKWIYYDNHIRQEKQNKDYSANKSKQVAWFLSNCSPTWSSGSSRIRYAQELAKYISVHIYGECGPYKCPRSEEPKCSDMLRNDYKFYLAFENSNCCDYITEKFLRALTSDVIPVVMGATRADYERHAPENSFIHVDDFSGPKELAHYLHELEKNSTLYNSYFKWKGTGEFINTFFWCRLCAMLHAPLPAKYYKNYYSWWNAPGICR